MDVAEDWEMNEGCVCWAQPGSRAVGCPNTSFAPLGYPRCKKNGGGTSGEPPYGEASSSTGDSHRNEPARREDPVFDDRPGGHDGAGPEDRAANGGAGPHGGPLLDDSVRPDGC